MTMYVLMHMEWVWYLSLQLSRSHSCLRTFELQKNPSQVGNVITYYSFIRIGQSG